MRIKSILIKNYRQYKDLYFTFDKKQDKNHDLHIIVASNGVGKSNLLNAITWCLYEDESHLQDKYKALPIVNLDTINNCENKEEIQVLVEIVVDVDGEDQIIRRSATFIKNETDDKRVFQKNSELSVQRNMFDITLGYSKPGFLYGEDADAAIDRIFPRDINEYFFFDNEQMNNYFKNTKGGAIQNAINVISKVSLLQDAVYRTASTIQEYKRSAGTHNNEISELQEEAEILKKRFEAEKKEYSEIENQIEEIKQELKKINENISGADNLRELEASKDQLQQQQKDLKNDLLAIDNDINTFIVKYTTLINMYPSFKKAVTLINEKDKKKQLPPDIKLEAFNNSKSNMKCELCGQPINDDTLKFIESEIERLTHSNPVNELLFEIKGKVYELMEETKQFEQNRDILLEKRTNKKNYLDEVEANLSALTARMKSIPNREEIINDLDKRDTLEVNLERLNQKLGIAFRNIEDYKVRADEAEKRVSSAIETKLKDDEKARKLNAANKLYLYLTSSESEIIKEIRDEISKETFENFVNLIWKQNTYKDIIIDENYNVDLIQKDGMSAIGSTSAAERALLALSFTNAIHHVSGFDSPLVIDSPVGRVSDINRKKFSESLANISENKQIIMMFTPDEYSSDVSSVFDPIANKSFANMNKNEDITSIK